MYSQISANKRRSLLLLFAFVALIAGLGYIITAAIGEPGFFLPTVIFAVVYAAISYFASAKMAIAMSGARPVAKADAPQLYRIVENLSIAGGLPMPKVYIIHDPSPNAFATGRDPQHAVVAVTTGILELLEDEELEGVLAHELSHIGNYDIRFMAIVVALVSVISMIADVFMRFSIFGGLTGDSDETPAPNPLVLALSIAAVVLAPLAAILLQMAVSRRREYLADASGALLTRYPDGLARALEKISQDPRGLQKVNSATAPLYISNPLKGKKKGLTNALARMFSTHPPIEDRIRRLQEMREQV